MMRQLITSLVLTLPFAFAYAEEPELDVANSTVTLWQLAIKARPDALVSMPQVVYALWQANPQAFRDNNINYLLQGSKLKLPSRDAMLAISAAEAKHWFKQAAANKVSGKKPVSVTSLFAAPASHHFTNTSAVMPAIASAAPQEPHPTVPHPIAKPSSANSNDDTTSGQSVPSDTSDIVDWRENISADYNLTLEQRYFPEPGEQGQAKAHSSVAFSAEWVWQSDDRAHQVAVEPFLRWDQRDSERHLIDLRQAYWQYAGSGYDIKAGIDIVFWGVTESQHLVDVINQTDAVGRVDGEAKLGQPMLNWNMYGDGGTLTLYLLPYFRERTFAGENGRLRLPLQVDNDQPLYESERAEHNLDFALRWSQQFGAADLALSYFEGNNREPEFRLINNGMLQPVYLQMQQLGIETQIISGSWIWKLESIYRKTRREDFVAATFGFEYTQVGLLDSAWDLGWIAEYQYDSRAGLAPVPGQNDIFIGGRFAANDAAGTEILLGFIQDLDNSDSTSGKLEASMRLSDRMRLRLDAWFFQSQQPTEPLYYIRQDDFIELSLDYYF